MMAVKEGQQGFGKKLVFWLLPLLFVLLLAVVGSVSLGSAQLSFNMVWKIIFSHLPFVPDMEREWPKAAEVIVWNIRMPRIMMAILVGAALAMAGVAYQGVLRNPLADPYILGVSSGASLGAASFILFGQGLAILGQWTLPLVAFVCGIGTLFIVYRLAYIAGKVQIETLLLSGVVVQAFLGAGLSLIMSISGEKMQQILYWLMGSLTLSDWSSGVAVAPYVIVGWFVIMLFTRELNLLALGEQKAHHLGMNVERTRLIVLLAASLTAGAAVAVSGVIGFVGLIVPHIMRTLVGSDHRVLLPVSAVAGAILLIAADTLARTIMDPQELPIGVITAFLGAPFFGYLLRKRRQRFF
ncbi:corrinoid ABC transporter permease [Aneurinibacillus danicus]|jgi:iron complex transport system permease protein|uniref:Corrinoid ABC transporter permease n=2 Tax=Aneurinibacillus TaxID=55079 RepID=A0A511V389_9BACL|nr:corrinoid ABC transporter permease [Aneurinibacillus danicus]